MEPWTFAIRVIDIIAHLQQAILILRQNHLIRQKGIGSRLIAELCHKAELKELSNFSSKSHKLMGFPPLKYKKNVFVSYSKSVVRVNTSCAILSKKIRKYFFPLEKYFVIYINVILMKQGNIC